MTAPARDQSAFTGNVDGDRLAFLRRGAIRVDDEFRSFREFGAVTDDADDAKMRISQVAEFAGCGDEPRVQRLGIVVIARDESGWRDCERLRVVCVGRLERVVVE